MGLLSDSVSPWIQSLLLSSLLLARTTEAALAIVYCSPDLTAGDFPAVFNTWQSNGACQTTCGGQYAYVVLQGQNCWCSNYAPVDQVSTYDCNTVCTGWQSDWCGNDQEGLYGYYVIPGVTPSGTAGGASATSRASSSSVSNTPSSSAGSSSTPPPVSSSSTGGSSSLTVSAAVQTSIRTSRSTVDSTSSTVSSAVSVSSVSSTTRSSSSSSSVITHSATPTEIYTSVTTVTGQVKTILVTPTPSSDSTLGSGTTINNNGGGGVSTGKVVGIVLGVAIGLGALIGLGVWLWLRRRHQRNAEVAAYENASSHSNTGIPSRQVSQMSSAGLLSKVPRIHTAGLPSGSNPRSAGTMGSNFDRRSLGTDQRLNPYAIYAHEESRHSNVSLQDNQDYSRQLRVANPDP